MPKVKHGGGHTTAVVIGHSFPRRLAFYIKQKGLDNFQLPSSHFSINVFGIGGLLISSLVSKQFNFVAQYAPQLVIMDIGTNDLSSPSSNPSTLANQVYSSAQVLCADYGLQQVVLLPILHRHVHIGRYPCRGDFNTKADEYNNILLQLTHQGPNPRQVQFWRHQGLTADCLPHLSDGVHLSPKGMGKYFHSVKKAVVKFAAYTA